MENIYSERIEALRSLMSDNGWDAVVITAYNSGEITYYDPERGRSVTAAKEKAEAMFDDGSRIYISFIY